MDCIHAARPVSDKCKSQKRKELGNDLMYMSNVVVVFLHEEVENIQVVISFYF